MNKFVCVALAFCVAVAVASQSEDSGAFEKAEEAKRAEEAERAEALGTENPDVSGFCSVLRNEVATYLDSQPGYASLFILVLEHNEEASQIKSAYRNQDLPGRAPISEEMYRSQLSELDNKMRAKLRAKNLESGLTMFCVKLPIVRHKLNSRLDQYEDEKLPNRFSRTLRSSGCALGMRLMSALKGCQILIE